MYEGEVGSIGIQITFTLYRSQFCLELYMCYVYRL